MDKKRFHMQCEELRPPTKLLSETLNPVDALNQATIDEKGYFNHQKLTNMTRKKKNNNSSRVYKNFNTVKKEPKLSIKKFIFEGNVVLLS